MALWAGAVENEMAFNFQDSCYDPEAEAASRAAEDAELARPKSAGERLEALRREIAALDCATARECGTYDAARVAALRAEAVRLEQQAKAESAKVLAEIKNALRSAAAPAGWSEEITRQRRSDWNAWVKSQRSISASKAEAREREQGWTFAQLKAAVAAHGL